MSGRPVAEVLGLPIRLHGIQLARAVDALVQPDADLMVGFEVLCGDGERRFLPFAVARIERDQIALGSALTLIDHSDADYYRRRSRRVADLGFEEPWVDEAGRVGERSGGLSTRTVHANR
jgi:hypothetical protein